jgi:MoxR-like ATPase
MSPHTNPTIRAIHLSCLAGVPLMLWSDPGAGKTSMVESYAHMRHMHAERLLLSRLEPIDIATRIVADGTIRVIPAPELQRLADAHAAGQRGLLFLDEINRASRETEGAALALVDRPPQGCSIVLAGNPPTRGQAARSLEAATANRVCHLDVSVDADAYADALLRGWPCDADAIPDLDSAVYTVELSTVRALASGFIRHNPADLSRCPADSAAAGRAWPSPRSWDAALRMLAVARSLGAEADDVVSVVGGCVGVGLGTTFLAYCADASVDPEVLLADPDGWSPPAGRIDKSVAALSMVVAAVTRNCTVARFARAWAVVGRVAKADAGAAAFGGNLLVALAADPPRGCSVTAAELTQASVRGLGQHAPNVAKALTAARGGR